MKTIFLRLGALSLAAAIAGATTGHLVRLRLPDVSALEEYRPPTMSRLFAGDGSEITTFATEKRIVLDPSQIPDSFRQALIASEDVRFQTHPGIDARGVLRALRTDLRLGRVEEGASTLTMQLAGMLYLDRSQRTIVRKFQEACLALNIEQRYSKEEIFRFYTNQVHMGHGLFGLGAAARHYFNKPARELTLSESAMLVGILPRPASYSPFQSLERATKRRNLVLRRMVETGRLTPEEAEVARQEPLVLAAERSSADIAPYFTEEVRQELLATHGGERLYGGGLQVASTLDPHLQTIAENAVTLGLQQLARRRGEISEVDLEDDTFDPEAEAALVAIDPATGRVLAMVGGHDFGRSEFNRVTQARRQSGSAFKPLVFAAAFAEGRTPADVMLDEPTVFLNPRRELPYQPENFSKKYYESMTLRHALEKSSNIVAVKLLDDVGYDETIRLSRRLGIQSRLAPYPSLALGAFEVTLLEMTSAYGAFANAGVWVEPHWIESVSDRQGRVLQRAEPRVTDAVSPETAYLMNHVLSGVIENGTATAATALGRTLAGKTGTTDSYTDAWFVGYSPDLVVGVWVGLDRRSSLGDGETGARAALPIWTEFMRHALADTPPNEFPVPSGIQFAEIDRRTGLQAHEGCGAQLREAFLAATEPVQRCTDAHHRQLQLPYPFQRYPLDGNGALMIPENELIRLLERELDVYYLAERELLESYGPEGRVQIAVHRLSDRTPEDSRKMQERFAPPDGGMWVGTDNRPAVVVWTRD